MGTILKCADPEEARCCGVSVETVIGTKSVVSNIVLVKNEDASSDSGVTTAASLADETIEMTTITSETDIQTESNDEILSTTSFENDSEIDTTWSYENIVGSTDSNEEQTTTPTIQDEGVEVRNSPGKFVIFASDNEVKESDPSYMKIVDNSPAMLVYAVKDDSEIKTLDAITKNEEAITSKPNEPSVESFSASVEPKSTEQDTTNNYNEDLITATEKLIENVPEIFHNDISDPNTILNNSESKSTNNTTESSSNGFTTPGTSLDLISTISVSNQALRHNKRRYSIYRPTPPISPPNPVKSINAEYLEGDKPNQASESVNENTDIPMKPLKSDVVGKTNGVIETVLDNEHKQQIIEVQSILASIKKLPSDKPKLIRSESLQELIAKNKQQFKPSLGRRPQNIGRTTTTEVPITTTTIESTETSGQPDKPKRKYNRRLPGRKFNEISTSKPRTNGNRPTKSTTTTTTDTSIKNEGESTTPRGRFSRRRLPIKPIPKSTPIETTTVAIVRTTKSSEPLPEINLPPTLEKRKRLFTTRTRGNYMKMKKTTTTTVGPDDKTIETTETAPISSTTELVSEKPTRKTFNFRRPQHRSPLKSNRSTTTEPTQISNEQNDS